MASYERLTALDRFFLDVERDEAHMHVAGAMLFEASPLRKADGGVDIKRIRDYIASRLHLIPRYRQRLAYVPIENHPVWIDDERMNLRYHVRHTSLPRPGDLEQLKILSGRVMSQKLDRSRPLWELWVVEGLASDHFALISKTHHCMIDGISGVDLMTVLLSIVPEESFEEAPTWNPKPPPGALDLLRGAVWKRALAPLEIAGFARRAITRPRSVCRSVGESLSALGQTLELGFRGASDTPLNRKIGAFRRFDWAAFDLREVKQVKNALGGTVNDVVLATVAGAIGRFLEKRGISDRQQAHMRFRVFCPVSVRPESDRGRLGNQVSGMLVDLPIGERDPRRRLATIAATTARLKEQNQALGAEVLTAVSEWTVPTLLSLGARLAARTRAYNMIVTNVPGPQIPLYMLGARLVEAYPLVPLFQHQALGIALFSQEGKLCWGFNADWDLMPDLRDLVAATREAFAELCRSAGIEPRGEQAATATRTDAREPRDAANT
jgi:diacylglycerol O-acyltransferase / wax synthase